jgi:hypothetical protein
MHQTNVDIFATNYCQDFGIHIDICETHLRQAHNKMNIVTKLVKRQKPTSSEFKNTRFFDNLLLMHESEDILCKAEKTLVSRLYKNKNIGFSCKEFRN